jgi:hypothetical protein
MASPGPLFQAGGLSPSRSSNWPKQASAIPIFYVKAHWRNYAGICTASRIEIMPSRPDPRCRMDGAGDAKAGRHSRR